MDRSVLLLLILAYRGDARIYCEKTKIPLEMGLWKHDLKHMDSAVVENKPVSISEGQMYVYENDFPGFIIKYIHVDNLAIRTCGASASIKSGGVGSSTLLVVLHAGPHDEIRSVVDVWGVPVPASRLLAGTAQLPNAVRHNATSLYLFKDWRALNHNTGII